MRFTPIFAIILLSGCGQSADQKIFQFMDSLSGQTTQTIILHKQPLTITPDGILFKSKEPMKIIGESANVCLILKSGVSSSSQREQDKQFSDAMQGSSVNAIFKMKDGKSFTSSNMGQEWNMYGKVSEGNELSACISFKCNNQPTTGSELSEIVIKASPSIKTIGVYWESTNAFDQPHS